MASGNLTLEQLVFFRDLITENLLTSEQFYIYLDEASEFLLDEYRRHRDRSSPEQESIYKIYFCFTEAMNAVHRENTTLKDKKLIIKSIIESMEGDFENTDEIFHEFRQADSQELQDPISVGLVCLFANINKIFVENQIMPGMGPILDFYPDFSSWEDIALSFGTEIPEDNGQIVLNLRSPLIKQSKNRWRIILNQLMILCDDITSNRKDFIMDQCRVFLELFF